VPEAMKLEVERQMKELLVAGLIVRSDSPMASSLVCVAKKQGVYDSYAIIGMLTRLQSLMCFLYVL